MLKFEECLSNCRYVWLEASARHGASLLCERDLERIRKRAVQNSLKQKAYLIGKVASQDSNSKSTRLPWRGSEYTCDLGLVTATCSDSILSNKEALRKSPQP